MAGAAVRPTEGLAGASLASGTGEFALGAPGKVPRRLPGRSRADRVTTPGRLRRMLAGLIVATLAWGALATFTASQHSSGAGTVVGASEPLTYDALQIWQSLSDANDAASAALLSGSSPPQALVDRYNADLALAKKDIVDAAERGGPAGDLDALSAGLNTYQDEVSWARANNLLGLPVGAGYLRQASTLMTKNLLPVASDLYTTEGARLTTASAQATGLPLIVITVLAGLALGYGYYRCGRWLTRRTHRVVNGGLLLAGAAGTVALLWLAVAFLAGRADLLTAQAQGSTPVIALAKVDIDAAKAHSDEALTLINNSGDDDSEKDFQGLEKQLGPGPGTLLALAQSAAAGSPAAASATAAVTDASAWFRAHENVRSADDGGSHQPAVTMVLSGPAGSSYVRLSSDLSGAITADNAAFASNASSGQGKFTGLVPGVVVATLVMVAGLAWGLSRRLAEYR